MLRPGGVIRICVPDLQCAIDQYLADQKQEALGFFLYDNGRGGLSAHKSMWDYGLLDDALRAAGFAAVRRCESRTGGTPDLDVLDAGPARRCSSLKQSRQTTGLARPCRNGAELSA